MFDSPHHPARGRGRHRLRRRNRPLRAAFTTAAAAAALSAGVPAAALAAPAPPATGLTDPLPGPRVHGPGTAIVILGYGLLPDGSLRPELVDRLRAGYVQALLPPQSPVIVTGGNPRHGITEAAAMADWLVRNGLPAHRVYQEPAASNTVQNAQRSAQLIHALGLRDAVVVTSENHLTRAVGSFAAAGIPVAATLTPAEIPQFVAAFGW
ncbi:YdcF family protein [Nocardia sp. NPDC003345]